MRLQTDNQALAVTITLVDGHTKRLDDHETRIRTIEHLTAKVVGGAIVGAAVGGWLLSSIGAWLK